MKRIQIDIRKDLFESIVATTQLRARQVPEMIDIAIVRPEDQKIFDRYFKEFIAEFKNETATFGRLKDYEGMLSYELNDSETEHKLDELQPLLSRIAHEYLLSRWYDDIGIDQLRNDSLAKYEKLLTDWRNHTARKAFVVPKYRPYF